MNWQIIMYLAYIAGSLFFMVGSLIGLLLLLGVLTIADIGPVGGPQ